MARTCLLQYKQFSIENIHHHFLSLCGWSSFTLKRLFFFLLFLRTFLFFSTMIHFFIGSINVLSHYSVHRPTESTIQTIFLFFSIDEVEFMLSITIIIGFLSLKQKKTFFNDSLCSHIFHVICCTAHMNFFYWYSQR